MRLTLVLRLAVVVLTCVVLWAGVLWLLPAMRPARANPGMVFVTVTGTGTACSESQPCGLQTALAQAVDGDEIYVAAGTYTGSGAAVVTLTHSIGLYGGWNGAASGAVMRDPVANRSILDGQGARRVVFAAPGIAFTVDGFTIQHGNATAGPSQGCGGGIFSFGAYPEIANNIVTGNTAYAGVAGGWGYGGGVYVDSSTGAPLIQGNQVLGNVACGSGDGTGGGVFLLLSDKAEILDNVVLNNTATITNGNGYGGGLSVRQSDGSVVTGNTVEYNRAAAGFLPNDGRGGGLYVEESMGVVLKNNRIRNNVAGVAGHGYGGGVAAYWAPELFAANNLLEGNTASAKPGAEGSGGAMCVHASQNVDISANQVMVNTANATAGYGGAVSIQRDSSFTMTNNIVAGNCANLGGGGLTLGPNLGEPVTGTLLHNTFVGNNVGSGNGRVAIYVGSDLVKLTLVNNLFSTHTYALYGASGSSATFDHTLFWADSIGDAGGGIATVSSNPITPGDPLLDATYHLRAGSPAIDAGVDAGVTSDIDGDPRPLDMGYDIGADEYTEPHRVYLPVVLKRR